MSQEQSSRPWPRPPKTPRLPVIRCRASPRPAARAPNCPGDLEPRRQAEGCGAFLCFTVTTSILGQLQFPFGITASNPPSALDCRLRGWLPTRGSEAAKEREQKAAEQNLGGLDRGHAEHRAWMEIPSAIRSSRGSSTKALAQHRRHLGYTSFRVPKCMYKKFKRGLPSTTRLWFGHRIRGETKFERVVEGRPPELASRASTKSSRQAESVIAHNLRGADSGTEVRGLKCRETPRKYIPNKLPVDALELCNLQGSESRNEHHLD